MVKLPDPLPQNEWDFSKAIEKLGIDHVFFYEYCRSTADEYPTFRARIEELISCRENKLDNDNTKSQLEENCKYLSKSPIGGFLRNFLWVPNLKYPDIPLIENDHYSIMFDFGRIRIGSDPIPFMTDSWSWKTTKKEDWKPVSWEQYFHKDAGEDFIPESDRLFERKDPLRSRYSDGFVTHSFIAINWACRDSEIVKGFKKFLKEERDELRLLKKVNRSPRNTGKEHRGIRGVYVPFGKKDALDWLAFWRKGKHIKNWDLYSRVYPKDFIKPGKEIEIEHLQNKAKNANVILEWFAKGGRIEGSRKGRYKRVDSIRLEDKYPGNDGIYHW